MSKHDQPTLALPPEDMPDDREREAFKKASSATRMVGRRIGPYRIEREIGRGGMGFVYLASDTALQRDVAVKLIPPEFAQSDVKLARFLRESRSAAKLSHPGIVPIYFAGVEDGIAFIAMEYVRGHTLTDFLRDRSGDPTPPRRATEIVRDCASALAHAHGRGLIHRDVKPDNIMIDEDGRVRIMDFGLARSMELSDTAKITEQGVYLGTPDYSSPEQVEAREIDGRSDLYSLGVLYYELLCGSTPFSAESPYRLFHKILNDEPQPVHEANPLVPLSCAGIVSKLLCKRPDDRYQTADELIADLESLMRVLDGSARMLAENDPSPINEASVRLPGVRPTSFEDDELSETQALATSSRGQTLFVVVTLVLLLALGAVFAAVSDLRPPPEPIGPLPGGGAGNHRGSPGDPNGNGNQPSPTAELPVVLIGEFENNVNDDSAGSLDYLRTALPELMISMLSDMMEAAPRLKILSRGHVQDVADDVGVTDLADSDQLAKVVEAAGADVVIRGSYYMFGGDLVVVSEIREIATGQVLGSPRVKSPVGGDLYDVFVALSAELFNKLRTRYFPEHVNAPAVRGL